MRRSSRTALIALAAVMPVLTPGMVAAAPASEASIAADWNCRQVIASDIRFFANSTGTTTTYPHTLLNGERFKSYGGFNGLYRAETAGPYLYGDLGYTTSDSRWVTQVPDSYCS